MTTEEKLEHFLTITVQDASAVKESMVSEYQKSLDHMFEEHKATALREAENQIKGETERAKREANIELVRNQLHIKRKISRKQSALTEEIFQEVTSLIQDFMKTDEYTELLYSQIMKSKEFAGNQYMIIYIDPNDVDKAEALQQRTGVMLKISGYSFLGGIRTVIPYKNILIDDSFEKKIETAKENFVFGGTSNE